MQRGYQDVGSWTLLDMTPLERRQAAWLFAQFASSKTVDLKKSHVGLTFVRDSTIRHESFTERAPKLGGLIEFYRSPDRYQWTDTGVNVPDYPRLAQLWWQNIGDVTAGTFTAQEAMDRLAGEMDDLMARMQAADEGPMPTAAAARVSTRRRTRSTGCRSPALPGPSSTTRSPRARRSPTTT